VSTLQGYPREVEGRRDARSALVVLVFLIAGPPLGAFLLLTAPFVAGLGQRWPTFEFARGLSTLGLASILAYVVGGLQAFFVGVVAGACQRRTRSQLVPLLPVLAAGLATGVLFLAFVTWKSMGPAASMIAASPSARTIATFLALHVGASAGCWLLANIMLWRHRARPLRAEPAP
jgi:hypothetical protein